MSRIGTDARWVRGFNSGISRFTLRSGDVNYDVNTLPNYPQIHSGVAPTPSYPISNCPLGGFHSGIVHVPAPVDSGIVHRVPTCRFCGGVSSFGYGACCKECVGSFEDMLRVGQSPREQLLRASCPELGSGTPRYVVIDHLEERGQSLDADYLRKLDLRGELTSD